MKRIALNGFGRIGRQVFKLLYKDPSLEIVAINNTSGLEMAGHLLKFDSTYGSFGETVGLEGNGLVVNGKKILVLSEHNPEQLPWKELGIDLVVENTGVFKTTEDCAKHLKAGAKKVLLTAPGKGMDLTIVKGVNEHLYNPSKHKIVSAGSCTTNCAAVMAKVLNDNFGIEKAFLSTVHAITNDQSILDQSHSDYRRARTALNNIIPTTTGAANSVAEVIPELKGKLDGVSYRVPVVAGSIVEIAAQLKKEAEIEKIKSLFKSVSENELKGILEYSEEALVSSDIVGNPHSCILDAELAKSMGTFVYLAGWYDNEWGYSCRVADLCRLM